MTTRPSREPAIRPIHIGIGLHVLAIVTAVVLGLLQHYGVI